MSAHASSKAVPLYDDPLTVGAIAVLAYVLADLEHEIVGHGIGFLLAGGRSCILTTTRLIEEQRLGDLDRRIFDLGGPLGNLAFAGIPWLAQHLLRRPAQNLRALPWLLMAFSLFWGFGYLITLVRLPASLPLWGCSERLGSFGANETSTWSQTGSWIVTLAGCLLRQSSRSSTLRF
jgi:hypothetical protein